MGEVGYIERLSRIHWRSSLRTLRDELDTLRGQVYDEEAVGLERALFGAQEKLKDLICKRLSENGFRKWGGSLKRTPEEDPEEKLHVFCRKKKREEPFNVLKASTDLEEKSILLKDLEADAEESVKFLACIFFALWEALVIRIVPHFRACPIRLKFSHDGVR